MGTAQEFVRNEYISTAQAIFQRILTQELPLIIVVACIFVIDITKANFFLKIIIGYVAGLAVLFAYLWISSFFLEVQPGAYLNLFTSFSTAFIFIAIFLNIKDYFKKRAENK
jgi:fructose-specific phosphotransferase system IIC component